MSAKEIGATRVLDAAGQGRGGRGEDRTRDLRIANAALSQLSYAPSARLRIVRGHPAGSQGVGTNDDPTMRSSHCATALAPGARAAYTRLNHTMFYFFQRGPDVMRCEVRAAVEGDGYEISVIARDGTERVERLATSQQVHERWLQLHESFIRDGWYGPVTQDGRA